MGTGVFGHDWAGTNHWRRALCAHIGVPRCRGIYRGARNARSGIGVGRGMRLWICELVGGGRVGRRRQQ